MQIWYDIYKRMITFVTMIFVPRFKLLQLYYFILIFHHNLQFFSFFQNDLCRRIYILKQLTPVCIEHEYIYFYKVL